VRLKLAFGGLFILQWSSLLWLVQPLSTFTSFTAVAGAGMRMGVTIQNPILDMGIGMFSFEHECPLKDEFVC